MGQPVIAAKFLGLDEMRTDELHRQRMWDKGYRLESYSSEQAFFESDGKSVTSLFDDKPIFAATFVRSSATK